MSESVSLTIGGQVWTGWQEIVVSRGLTRCSSHFQLSVTERFVDESEPDPFAPYTAVIVKYGKLPVLTGFIDQDEIMWSADQHGTRVSGRSKTGQLVDCMPDVPSGQYLGYSLAAIAAGLGQIFDVTSRSETSLASVPLQDATLERSETAFRFLDRLGATAGILLCDDPTGALVLTTAGTSRASGSLVAGVNVKRARMMANGVRRFSTYIVKGQRGIHAAAGGSGFVAGPNGTVAAAQASPSTGTVLTQQRAVATDPLVPLYRPHVTIAESQLDQALMQRRADWQRAYAFGHSVQAVITVVGWIQPDGTLWQINQIVAVDIPALHIEQDLLIMAVDYRFSLTDGHTTDITVGPVEGATPDPSLIRASYKKGKHKHGKSSISWDGVVPAAS